MIPNGASASPMVWGKGATVPAGALEAAGIEFTLGAVLAVGAPYMPG